MQTFVLHIASTGDLLKTEETESSLVVWQKKWERKLLRYKRTPDKVKEAILNGDTIAGWASYDAYLESLEIKDPTKEITRIFRGYEKYFDNKVEIGMCKSGVV